MRGFLGILKTKKLRFFFVFSRWFGKSIVNILHGEWKEKKIENDEVEEG